MGKLRKAVRKSKQVFLRNAQNQLQKEQKPYLYQQSLCIQQPQWPELTDPFLIKPSNFSLPFKIIYTLVSLNHAGSLKIQTWEVLWNNSLNIFLLIWTCWITDLVFILRKLCTTKSSSKIIMLPLWKCESFWGCFRFFGVQSFLELGKYLSLKHN